MEGRCIGRHHDIAEESQKTGSKPATEPLTGQFANSEIMTFGRLYGIANKRINEEEDRIQDDQSDIWHMIDL